MRIEHWKHCPACAQPLSYSPPPEAYVHCESCGFRVWDNPLPTTLALIVRGDDVLLVRRNIEPRHGMWDTVGGFLDGGETAEECVHREVFEELGCRIRNVRLLGTFTSIYGEGGRSTLGVTFTCELEPGGEIQLCDENSEARWFPLAGPEPEMAFPDGSAALAALRASRR